MDSQTQTIIEQWQGLAAEPLLENAIVQFANRVALASSFGAEDQVLTHMLCGIVRQPAIFTLDTGRLPEETYDLIERTQDRYNIAIEVLFPDSDRLEEMTAQYGPNLFYQSVEKRRLCCHIRKVEPLQRKLATLDAWICGLRSEQALTRSELRRVDWDDANGLIKIAPLADWTTEQVWQYIRENDIPYNRLHDQGYPSIGCAPCTRPVEPDEDIRSGRWWWEKPEHKECGLHWNRTEPTEKRETQ